MLCSKTQGKQRKSRLSLQIQMGQVTGSPGWRAPALPGGGVAPCTVVLPLGPRRRPDFLAAFGSLLPLVLLQAPGDRGGGGPYGARRIGSVNLARKPRVPTECDMVLCVRAEGRGSLGRTLLRMGPRREARIRFFPCRIVGMFVSRPHR